MIRLFALVIVATPIVVALADDPPATKAPEKSRRSVTTDPLADRQRELVRKLHSPIRFERPFDGVPLRDILEYLADRCEMTVVIDPTSFREAFADANVGMQPIRLSKLGITTPRQLLEYVLKQVDGGFLIRGDHVEIVSRRRLNHEVFGKLEMSDKEIDRTLLPCVNVAPRDDLLPVVLADIADQSGRNVVIDPRVKDKLNKGVTVRLINTPVDTAVSTLAQMFDLVAVPVDNTFVITTRPLAGGFIVDSCDLKAKGKQ